LEVVILLNICPIQWNVCSHKVFISCGLIDSVGAGIAYSMDDPERSATMSRIETKKSKEKKSILSTLPASSEEILEGTTNGGLCIRDI